MMDNTLVIISVDADNNFPITVSHPSRTSEQFLEDWRKANREVHENAYMLPTDEATVNFLTRKGYVIQYHNFHTVYDGGIDI